MDTRFQSERILIVDDEYVNVMLLKHGLEQAGFSGGSGITDPRQAAVQLREFKPNIILLDLQMPVLDGFDVMGLVKQHVTEDEFLPILVLTADTTQATKRRALAEGASDYITKPFDIFEVLLRTRNLLRTRILHGDLRAQNAALEERVRERTRDLE